jgi:hypothetical protein
MLRIASLLFPMLPATRHAILIPSPGSRARSPAAVSLAALALATALFISELRYYWTTEKVEIMEVDAVR